MFYSQTFLARKGPLGTVWCAAHLQHRLKKSHYTSTNIPSTVERIMFPEVPIALRMSGHLLLGVVRIYAKKVDYLYHDCNVFFISLSKTFPTVNVNLPEDATHAPAHTVTLPQKLNLDAVDLDDHVFDNEYDNHLRNQEDITLTDQIPVGRDVYVSITFDEDITIDSANPPEEAPYSGVRQMEEDILCGPPIDADVGTRDPGPSNHTEVHNVTQDIQDPGASNLGELPTESEGLQEPGASNQIEGLGETVDFQQPGPCNLTEILSRPADYTSLQNIPEVEVMRDAHHDFSAGNLSPLFPDVGNVVTEPIVSPDQILNEKEIDSPALEDMLASGGQSLQFQQHSEPPASGFTQEGLVVSDIHVSTGHSLPALAILSTPEQQPKQRVRKRARLDKSLVLPNKFMKKALEDSSDLLRKKRNMPSNALGVWKFNNRIRKEQVFNEPLVTGSCVEVCNIFKKDYIATKPHLVATATERATPEPMIVDSPPPETEAIPERSVVQSPNATQTIQEPAIAESHNHTTDAIQEPRFSETCAPVPEIEMEIEQLRHTESNIGDNNLPEFMSSPARVVHSPFRRDDQTPSPVNSFRSELVPQVETTSRSAAPSPLDVALRTETHGSELEMPRVLSEDWLGLEGSGLSGIPELINSAEAEDLSFLEADNNTPAGSQACEGVESLSVRTRAVIQYLKRHSPITPVSEGQSTDLSMNKILEGKTRKLCARMFFETLVLKSYGLVDVEQKQPYGDINLKLTPKMSKTDI